MGQQWVSELRKTGGTSGHRERLNLAQQSQMGVSKDASLVLAMQKVVGSSPLLRFTKSSGPNGVLCFLRGSQHTRSRSYVVPIGAKRWCHPHLLGTAHALWRKA